MRRILVESVKDGDILAKDLFSSSGVVLMSEGTRLKKEYITRLSELGVEQIYIVEDDRDGTIIEKEKTYYKQIVKVDDMGVPHIVKKQIVD